MSESEINNMGVAGLIGLGATLGVVHVLTGADHMSALAQLSCGARLKGFWLGMRWGIGHSSGLLLMCVVQPLVRPPLIPQTSTSICAWHCLHCVDVLLVVVFLDP